MPTGPTPCCACGIDCEGQSTYIPNAETDLCTTCLNSLLTAHKQPWHLISTIERAHNLFIPFGYSLVDDFLDGDDKPIIMTPEQTERFRALFEHDHIPHLAGGLWDTLIETVAEAIQETT